MTFAYRPHQTAAVEAVIHAALVEGISRQLVHMATGAGKTIFARLLVRTLLAPGERVVFLAHREDLLDQAYRAFTDPRWPEPFDVHECGIVQAERDAYGTPIVFASIATLYRPERLDRVLSKGKPKLVIYDECHHAPSLENEKVVQQLLGPDTLHIGLTATPNRADGLSLRRLYDQRTYSVGIMELLTDTPPLLSDIRRIVLQTDLDTSDVEFAEGGELDKTGLERAITRSRDRYSVFTAAIKRYVPGLPGLVYAASVKDAHRFAEAANASGIPTAVITGKTPKLERDELKAQFAAGQLHCLTNVRVLTEGSDFPFVRWGLIACATAVQENYAQIVGRLIRTLPGEDVLPLAQRQKQYVVLFDVPDNHHKVAVLSDMFGSTDRALGTNRSIKEALDAGEIDPTPQPQLTFEPRPVHLSVAAQSVFSDCVWRQVGQAHRFEGPDGAVAETVPDLMGWHVDYTDPLGRAKRLTRRPIERLEHAWAVGEQYAQEQTARAEYRSALKTDQRLRNSVADPASVARAARVFRPLANAAGVTRGEIADLWAIVGDKRAGGLWNSAQGKAWRAAFFRRHGYVRQTASSGRSTRPTAARQKAERDDMEVDAS